MAVESDVVISWYIGVPPQTRALFQRPTTFIEMPSGKAKKGTYADQLRALGPTPLQAICRQRDIAPLRVCLLGFSEGCQGVREALRSGDGSRVDSAIAIDGIHTEYDPPGTKGGKVEATQLAPWLAQAERSVADGRLCLVTTSSIVPSRINKETNKTEFYVSTTDTANILWRTATGLDKDIASSPMPDGMWATELANPLTIACSWGTKQPILYAVAPTYRYRRDNGLIIYNYANLDKSNSGCADHIFQAKFVGPLMIGTYLADRWNVSDPKTGVSLISGLPEPARGWRPGVVGRVYDVATTLGEPPPSYAGAGILLPMDAPPDPPDLSKYGRSLPIPGAANDASPPPSPPPAPEPPAASPPAPSAGPVELPEVTITPAEPPPVTPQAQPKAASSTFAAAATFGVVATLTAIAANALMRVARGRRRARV